MPIAVVMLAALGIVNSDKTDHFCGELWLDGRVKPVFGCLPMAVPARDCGYRDTILPAANPQEAAVLCPAASDSALLFLVQFRFFARHMRGLFISRALSRGSRP